MDLNALWCGLHSKYLTSHLPSTLPASWTLTICSTSASAVVEQLLDKDFKSTCMFGLPLPYPCHCGGRNKPRQAHWFYKEGERYFEWSQTTLAKASLVLMVPDNSQMYASAKL